MSWSVDEIMPRRDGPENLKILSELRVEIGPLSRRVVFLRISTGRDELRSYTPRDVPNVGGGVSIVWLQKTCKNCVSFLVSKNRSQKLINRSYLKQQSPPLFVSVSVLLLQTSPNYGYELYATYVSRKEGGGGGLASIEESFDASIQRLEDYIEKYERGQITATRNDTDNTMTNRMTITRKQKWEEKRLYVYFKRIINNISHEKI